MKKFFITILGVCVLTLGFCGCTKKQEYLWVKSANDEIIFDFNYRAYNVVFDGVTRSFEVKDASTFISEIKKLTYYLKEIEFANDNSKTSYLFIKENAYFIVTQIGDNKFSMQAATINLFKDDGQTNEMFSFPPITMNSIHYAEEFELEITQNWDYFKTYYAKLGDEAEIDLENKTITLISSPNIKQVTITYAENKLFFRMS